MDKLLFVVRAYSTTGAQPNRFRQLHKHLKSRFEIHVLELTHGVGGIRVEERIIIHSLEYSKLGKLLNPDKKRASLANSSDVKNPLDSARILIKKLIRNLLFPDSVVPEAFRIRKEVRRLVSIYGFRLIVVSAFPFTTLCSIGGLRKIFKVKIVLDIGDPFYSNSDNGSLRDLLARQFEKHYLKEIDALVVTNANTKTHYLTTFNNQIQTESVYIVEQGVNEEFIRAVNMVTSEANRNSSDIRLVYAGQLYRKLREPFNLYKAVEICNSSCSGIKISLHMYGTYNKDFYPRGGVSENIKMMGQVSFEEIVKVILGADIVVFIDNAFGLQTPGKIFELALLKKHVLFISDNLDSPASSVARSYNHFHFTGNSPMQIAQAIDKILSSGEVPEQETLNKNFLWEKKADEYTKVFDSLLA